MFGIFVSLILTISQMIFLKKKNPTFLFMSTNAEQELPGTNQVIEI